MTFLPTCTPDRRPATYVPGTGYVCSSQAAPVVDAAALNELVMRGWCRGAGAYARCPWLIQELGADPSTTEPSTTKTLLTGIAIGVLGTFLVASINYERVWR